MIVDAGQTTAEVPVVQTLLQASGSVADYDESRKDSIKSIVASSVGVTSDKVTIKVLAGSVVIDITVQFDDASAATTAQASLATSMQSAEAASTFLSGASVEVIATPAVVSTTAIVVVAISPSQPPSMAPPTASSPSVAVDDGTTSGQTSPGGSVSPVSIVVIVLGALVLLLLLLAAMYVLYRRNNNMTMHQVGKSTGIDMTSTTAVSGGRVADEISVDIGSPKIPLSPAPGSPQPGSPSATPRGASSPIPRQQDNTPSVLEGAIAQLEESKI